MVRRCCSEKERVRKREREREREREKERAIVNDCCERFRPLFVSPLTVFVSGTHSFFPPHRLTPPHTNSLSLSLSHSLPLTHPLSFSFPWDQHFNPTCVSNGPSNLSNTNHFQLSSSMRLSFRGSRLPQLRPGDRCAAVLEGGSAVVQ